MINKMHGMKIFQSIMLCCIFMHGMYVPIISVDNDHRNDTTDLINYIEHRNQYFPWLKQECRSLWYGHVGEISDMTKVFEKTSINKLTNLDEKLRYLYEYRQQIKNFEQDTQEEIHQLLQEGESLDAVDEHGKRAIDYVTHLPVYYALRKEGAKEEPKFLWDERKLFWDVNKFYIGSGLIAAALAGIAWYTCSSSQQQRKAEEEENPYDVQDEFGRTQLMNYLQVQEDKIHELGKKVSLIKRCYGLKYDSQGNLIDGSITISGQSNWEIESKKIEYARLFREQAPHWKAYNAEYETTKVTIQSMLYKKVNLALKDKQGKTVLNYCKTLQFYTMLRNAGAPFDYCSYCYFNPMISLVIIASGVGIMMGVSSLYQLYKQNNQLSARGDEFDRLYEAKYKTE